MDNQINFRRIGLLIKLTFVLNKKRITYTALAGLGMAFILTLFPIVTGQIKSTPIFSDHEMNFVVILFVFGAMYAGGTFNANRSKSGITEYLMIPASTLEKFLSEVLLTIGFSLILFILYWFYAFLINLVLSNTVDAFFIPFNLDLSYYGLVLIGYLFMLGLFQFGAITFRQMPFLKVLLWTLPFFVIVFVLMTLSSLGENSMIGYDEYTLRSLIVTPIVQYKFYLSIPMGLMFWFLTYLKLKEKEA